MSHMISPTTVVIIPWCARIVWGLRLTAMGSGDLIFFYIYGRFKNKSISSSNIEYMIRFLNLLFFAVMVVMNYLANALPLNNKTTGELSDSFPNLFVPAGITFSIWGIIYILVLAYSILQFRAVNESVSLNIGWAFGISCILNALWIIFWHYGKLPFSLIAMLGMLGTLIYINVQIKELPLGIIKVAFGIYLGWICIATIANVTTLLVHYNWTGFGLSEETWTIVMISAGVLIAAISLLSFKNPFIALSVIWAFAGIILKRHYDYRSIVMTAGIGIVILLIITVYGFLRKV